MLFRIEIAWEMSDPCVEECFLLCDQIFQQALLINLIFDLRFCCWIPLCNVAMGVRDIFALTDKQRGTWIPEITIWNSEY